MEVKDSQESLAYFKSINTGIEMLLLKTIILGQIDIDSAEITRLLSVAKLEPIVLSGSEIIQLWYHTVDCIKLIISQKNQFCFDHTRCQTLDKNIAFLINNLERELEQTAITEFVNGNRIAAKQLL